jgi:hypothetical protein
MAVESEPLEVHLSGAFPVLSGGWLVLGNSDSHADG